tara:strand:- start:1853 stop:2095 length:243 start_codon:yes stop_codon:yes gene_type:complete
MAEAQSDMVRLGGLWKQVSGSGIDYLSGSFGNAKMMVFKNTNKEEGSNQPDYNIVMANKQKPEGEGTASTPSNGSGGSTF